MKRIRSIVALMLLVVLFAAMVPETVQAAKLMKVTGTKLLRMRIGPGEDYNVKARYKKGTVVTVLKYSKGWYYVKVNKDGTKGWMSKNFLTKTTTPIQQAKESASGNAVAQKNVYMRRGPSKNYDRITTVRNGKVMKIIGKSGSWYKVRYGGKTGFVYGGLVKVVK